MPPAPRSRSHLFRSTPPLDELFLECQVCGMQVDADKTASPEQEVITHTTTGTTYHDSDVANIDLDVEPVVSKYGGGCFFAGAPIFLGRQTQRHSRDSIVAKERVVAHGYKNPYQLQAQLPETPAKHVA